MNDAALVERLSARARKPLENFLTLTPVQRLAVPILMNGTHALIIAPTAAGKTEAALVPLMHLSETCEWRGTPSVLWVAPTRALVNDLYRRLAISIAGHARVGRRTGEHRDKDADLLVTTPESLDSMIVRGWARDTHVLGGVRAIVLDELHLLADGPRGTQLNMLLRRLEYVTGTPLVRVALSATVTAAEELAARFLGPQAQVLSVGGGRSLVIHRLVAGPLPEQELGVPDPLAAQLCTYSRGPGGARQFGEFLLNLRGNDRLKALVFVASRAECDALTAELSAHLGRRSPIAVVGHHGSLSKEARERAEGVLAHADESVAVATSTLEIGIDIGDITTVVLAGPPGSVGSLLQRVGRANRRGGAVHLVPLATSEAAACTMASMLRAAIAGELDPISSSRHYSVALQQAASCLRAARDGRVGRERFVDILATDFGAPAAAIADELAAGGWITIRPDGRIAATDALGEVMDNPLRLHANIGGAGEIPIVDDVTGDAIAWVPRQKVGKRIVVAGKTYVATPGEDEIRVKEESPKGSEESVRYSTRRMPLTRAALRHFARGMGLPDSALVEHNGSWIHFGGALFASLLRLTGFEGTAYGSVRDPRKADLGELDIQCARHWASIETLFGFGPFQRALPTSLRKRSVVESVPAAAVRQWQQSLCVGPLSFEQRRILTTAL
jgi:ATP-dependent Lhr-like helicase